MKAAKELKKYLEKIVKRGDLNIRTFKIGDKVNKQKLNNFKGKLPDDLLNFYAVMNGCNLLSSFSNNSDLQVGINIPPIERVGEFVKPSDAYNFADGLEILLFEWIENQYSPFFYCKPESELDVNKAEIITAVSAKEDKYKVLTNSLGTWIEMALENGLALGWGNPENFSELIKENKLLFSLPPKKRRILLPNTRVSLKDSLLRGRVLRQHLAKDKDIYGRQDFVLIEFDLGDKYWMNTASLKTISNKKDYYESLIVDPKSALMTFSETKAEESVIAFAKIAMSKNQYNGLGGEEGNPLPAYASDSIRYVQLFSSLTLLESTAIILTISNKWIEVAKDTFKQTHLLPIDGSEYNKKDDHVVHQNYIYKYMLENLLGCLMYLIARERFILMEEFTFPNQQKKEIKQVLEKLKALNEMHDPINGVRPKLEHFGNLFDSNNIYLGQRHTIQDWQQGMGIGDFPYIVSY